jgi:hypothetical protein
MKGDEFLPINGFYFAQYVLHIKIDFHRVLGGNNLREKT